MVARLPFLVLLTKNTYIITNWETEEIYNKNKQQLLFDIDCNNKKNMV